jgi:hypothetical protein
VIELASRRVQILGSTPHPPETFMGQIGRNLTLADADGCRVLICDRDAKWSRAVRGCLQDAGIRVVQTPYREPNANAHARNVLLRLITRDEPAQVVSAERFVEKGAWVSHLVLAEMVWVHDAVYERTAAEIAIAIELLLNHRDLNPSRRITLGERT